MSESRQRAWQALDIGPEWRLRGQPGTAVAPGPEGTQAGAEQDGHVRDGNTVHGDGSPAGLGWAGLREAVAGCRLCTLCETRRSTVFGVGDERAGWMVVGEAPGAEEDRVGEPFVGRAGQLLDAMLASVGRSRGAGVFIANALKCRPPENRNPLPEELARCAPYLRRQIELVSPELILVVGKIAAQALLDTEASIASLRGRVHRLRAGAAEIPVVVTYHPAYLLRAPQDKAEAWADLRLACSLSASARR
jgi:DNA polymerase